MARRAGSAASVHETSVTTLTDGCMCKNVGRSPQEINAKRPSDRLNSVYISHDKIHTIQYVIEFTRTRDR